MNRLFRNIGIIALLAAVALFLAEMHINKESPRQTWNRFDDTFNRIVGPPTPAPYIHPPSASTPEPTPSPTAPSSE